MNFEVLEAYQRIYQQLTNYRTDGGYIVGQISNTSANIIDLKNLNQHDLLESAFLYNTSDTDGFDISSDDVPSNDIADFKIGLKLNSAHSVYFIGQTWNDLLAHKNYVATPVEGVYIAQDNELASESCETDQYKNYRNLSSIWKILTDVAYSTDHVNNECLIFCGQPLKISLTSSQDILDKTIDISVYNELLSRDQHQEAMNSLIREGLFSLLSDIDEDKRFEHLITKFSSFTSKILVGYEQFIQNYSFDRVRKEYQEKATEYVIKINKVFDDVAAKLFSIPLAVWFAASQIKPAALGEFDFYKNITYLTIVLFLVIVIIFTLRGQFATLDMIKRECQSLFDRLSHELTNQQHSDFEDSKEKINRRYNAIKRNLKLSLFFAVLALASVGLLCFYAWSKAPS